MNFLRLRHASLLVGFLPLLACGPQDGELLAEDLMDQSQELTNSPATAGSTTVVRINGCTGTILSPHYIVTAAHCFGSTNAFNVTVRGGQNSETLLYSGMADVGVHFGWVDQAADRESWDVAAVHLRGAGLPAALGRAKIYNGPETPWKTRNAQLFIEGYGFGSNPGGVDDCSETNQQADTKRRAAFNFKGTGRVESGVWQSAVVSHPSRTTCQGDSGSPYFIRRNNLDFMVAVHSRSQRVHGGEARGSLIAPKLQWIQAFAELVQPRLSCSLVRDHRFPTYTEHYDCREGTVTPPPVVR
ncbi:MAG: trypsin-like serine protease [Myxococcaceae bacterium]